MTVAVEVIAKFLVEFIREMQVKLKLKHEH